MDSAPRRPFVGLAMADIPTDPGVYALYREGERLYVGKANSLRSRLGNHRGEGASMTNSALRRNVAALVGIASSAHIKAQRYRTTIEDAGLVTAWLAACDVAWIACDSSNEAAALERDMKREDMPALTKI
jgi:hypothetical protein